ncbi:MAG: undecaprenyl-diphosphate phosphatase [Deltaproteobacteria bacterium]|nr:undecaprenyl-diphosphate phosphatase [Deltaproteobacteria bacterium]
MEWLLICKAAALGIVEGITEFLPISSTGHLIIAGRAINFHDPTFDIFIQLGAIGAVVAMYRADIWQRCRGALRPGADRRVAVNVLVAFLPAAVVGAGAHNVIKQYLFGPLTVAVALLVGGVAIIGIERAMRRSLACIRSLEGMHWRHGLVVGSCQVISMWPGFSRAAASILGGMVAGLDRTTATVFSFYLAIPTMFGATAVDLYGAWDDLHWSDLPTYAVGFATAFVVAWAAIRGMLHYIARHNFTAFGIYRLLIGGGIIALIATGTL